MRRHKQHCYGPRDGVGSRGRKKGALSIWGKIHRKAWQLWEHQRDSTPGVDIIFLRGNFANSGKEAKQVAVEHM